MTKSLCIILLLSTVHAHAQQTVVEADVPDGATLRGVNYSEVPPETPYSPFAGTGLTGYGPIGVRGNGLYYGVIGVSPSQHGIGGFFQGNAGGVEVWTHGPSASAVFAQCGGDRCSGVSAYASSRDGVGVTAYGTRYGIYATADAASPFGEGHAGWFNGAVVVTGSLRVDSDVSSPTIDALWQAIEELRSR